MDDLTRVIQNGYCIGCGVCPFVDSSISMYMDEDGKYQAKESQIGQHNSLAPTVCPFANASYNEDVIGKELFGSIPSIQHDDSLGYYLHTYAGHASSAQFRSKGSSGGMVSWIASKLLETHAVDAIIHVKDCNEQGKMYSYQVSHSVDELESGAKSKYYPIELSEVLQYVNEHDERYAIIGIPCFIKAMRMLEKENEIIRNRVIYHIGLVCGHLKSTFFGLSEAWESGIEPQNVKKVDFRYKLPGRGANDYGVQSIGTNNQGKPVEVVKPTRDLCTTNWGYGYFKYNACEYCDDVLAECADVTCGDAWLPQYQSDSNGTNVIVVRDPRIQQLFEQYANEITIESIPASVAAESQRSGLRHRREGLSYRLYMKDQRSEWRPTKRIEASSNISKNRKKVYEDRILLMEESFKAFHAAEQDNRGMEYFKEYMAPFVKAYKKVDNPLYRRILRKMKNLIKKIIH